MNRRTIAVVTVVLASAGTASAGDRWFRHRDVGPGPGWTYYGLDSGPFVTSSPCAGKGCGASSPVTGRAVWPGPGPLVPVYGPIPGMLNVSDLYRGFPAYPGIGWYGTVSPSPRPRVTTVNVYPQ